MSMKDRSTPRPRSITCFIIRACQHRPATVAARSMAGRGPAFRDSADKIGRTNSWHHQRGALAGAAARARHARSRMCGYCPGRLVLVVDRRHRLHACGPATNRAQPRSISRFAQNTPDLGLVAGRSNGCSPCFAYRRHPPLTPCGSLTRAVTRDETANGVAWTWSSDTSADAGVATPTSSLVRTDGGNGHRGLRRPGA